MPADSGGSLTEIALMGGLFVVGFVVVWIFMTLRQGERASGGTASPAKNDGAWDWFTVLGVASNASPAEIEAAYAQQLRAHDPDRVVGTDPAQRSSAAQRTAEINRAFGAAKRLGRV